MVDSLILLYDSTEMSFETNGLGALPDAISCEVTEERNGLFELEMEYPIIGRRYSELALRKIILAKSNPYSTLQPFRIYGITKPINGIVTVNAQHISYDLSGLIASPFEADSVLDAFIKMKEASVTDCPFDFWTDKTTLAQMKTTLPSSMRSLLGGVRGSFLDIYGGEYEFDRFSVKLWSERGANRGVSIRYGKNLTDLNQEENCSNVYTGVYPFWYDEEEGLVELSEKYIEAEGNYDYVRIYPLDLGEYFSERPTETEMRTKAESYMKDNKIGIPKVALEVSFVLLSQSKEYENISVLENVHLCDTVNVQFEKLGVTGTAKCIKTVYNVLTDKYIKIGLGDAKSNLSTSIAEQDDSIKEQHRAVKEQRSYTRKAAEHASKLITGGLGGYALLHSSTGGKKPDEFLIMDTDNILTARSVWRWNKGGLGYSSTGYAGPYKTAITQDGQIVANFITAGVFDGAIIKAGSILGDMLSVEYRNGVKAYADSVGAGVYAECVTLIENTANAIRLLVRESAGIAMYNYCRDPFFGKDLEYQTVTLRENGKWYSYVGTQNNTYVTNYLGMNCARISNTVSVSKGEVEYRFGAMKDGSYKIRFKAACDPGNESSATIKVSTDYFQAGLTNTSFTTKAGALSSIEWTQFEYDLELTSNKYSSNPTRYFNISANTTDCPVYVTEVEFLGSLETYVEAQIKITSDSITQEVTRAKNAESELKSSIKINADKIESCVTKGNVGSYITQYYDNVLVAFNNSSKYVQITAGAIGIYDGTVNDSGRRARFDQNGEHFYRDNYYVGKIGTNQLKSDNTKKGLVFDLEYEGAFMGWGEKKTKDATEFSGILGFYRQGVNGYNEGLHLGCNLYAHGYKIIGANVTTTSASGYEVVDGKQVQLVTDIQDNGDGTISWTTSNFNVRNGLITAVPEEAVDLES